MLNDIQQARHYILLEMYLVSPGEVCQRFFNALLDAANRDIKVYVLLDAFGSRSLDQESKNKLSHENIHLVFYNPFQPYKHKLRLFRDHRKLLVIDGNSAYVGGAGFIDQFDSRHEPRLNWRENMVKIKGENVLQWQALFKDNWQRWSDIPVTLIETECDLYSQKGRVSMTSGPDFLEIKRSFINHVNNAQHRLWMSTAYFAPSRKLRRALRRAALRGIDVRLLIPGPITDHPMARYIAQHYYSRMLLDGIRIFEYQPRFMHAKLVLCDNWTSIGSCNIDRWNLRWNLDANQEIDDTAFTDSVIAMFENDFGQSTEITLEKWRRRSLLNKIKIIFWAYMIRFADTLLTRFKIIRHWKDIRKQDKRK
ncbi:MAG: phospholipase D-like domain-containing protein [Gammaproteobacteria bacterium]|nr:phospholipase D-like domain-containing protein [Gammaproteobacteria bacterium]